MSKKPISPSGDSPPSSSGDGGTDWAALAAVSDDEAQAAASADPDAQPTSDERLSRARRVGLGGSLRFRLKLSRAEFCRHYRVPLDTLIGWERGTIAPDAVAMALLRLIEADPGTAAATLAKAPAAAE